MEADEGMGVTAQREESRGVYYVQTLGCQMNEHDSERIAGVLRARGYQQATPEQVRAREVDVMVLNTCAVRDNATKRMYGTIGRWHRFKQHKPDTRIAVGGCMAQKDRERIVKAAPWVDAVFGTRDIGSLPGLLEKARKDGRPQVGVSEELRDLPGRLPAVRASRSQAWVSISVGCNNTCTFCIVPSVRGRERDRSMEDVLQEVRDCVRSGARQVTLLGQNVNSYGWSTGDRYAFARLLRACGRVPGLERIRFTSPHPAAFTDDVIAAMAETPTVMHQLHMPLQSGSDRILRAMRRSYRSQRFLEILDKVRAAMPDALITTDIIVGFPGETEEDFQATMDVMRRSRFSSAYIFEYSPRPGTSAARMTQLPKAVVHDRFERLQALQESITMEHMQAFLGKEAEVLIGDGHGRHDGSTHRVTGHERTGVLVHVGVPEGMPAPKPGDLVTCTVTQAGPHYLIADPDPQAGQVYDIR